MQDSYLTIPALAPADVSALRQDLTDLRQTLSAFDRRLVAPQLVRIEKFDRGAMSAGAGGAGDLLAAVADTQAGMRGYVVQRLLNGFGGFVKQQRIARGWSQDDLAKEAGTTESQISLLERGMGKRGPSLAMVARILLAFDMELDFGSDLGVETPMSAPERKVAVKPA